MKAKTSLWVLGLFTLAGAVTVSCGGSSDGDNNNTAGTTGKAGTSGKAGSSSAAGAGNNTGGTGNNNNGGTGTNNGGTNNGGSNDLPGFGGAGVDAPSCDAGTMTGSTCSPGDDQACQLNATTYCGCQGTTWTCIDTSNLGGGGAGPLIPQATCPANAKTGDACSGGPGLCAGTQCYCGPGSTVMCL